MSSVGDTVGMWGGGGETLHTLTAPPLGSYLP